jgi:hypothetical protein
MPIQINTMTGKLGYTIRRCTKNGLRTRPASLFLDQSSLENSSLAAWVIRAVGRVRDDKEMLQDVIRRKL